MDLQLAETHSTIIRFDEFLLSLETSILPKKPQLPKMFLARPPIQLSGLAFCLKGFTKIF